MRETQVVENLVALPTSQFSVCKPTTKKRKRASAPSLKNEKNQQMNVSVVDGIDAASSAKKMKEDPLVTVTKAEKRLRVFRKKAPLTYMTKLERATSQR